jgi:hypothetical protein
MRLTKTPLSAIRPTADAHRSLKSPMRYTSLMLAAVALLSSYPATAANPAQTIATCEPTGAGCDQTTLRAAVHEARTIAAQAPPRDRVAQAELGRLVHDLGKQLAPPHGAADLTLILSQPQPSGVEIGPGDRDLATLQVYSGRSGQLIWVERVRGQGNKPWPAIIGDTLQQFRTSLGEPQR